MFVLHGRLINIASMEELKEGIDYYIDQDTGLLVFTAEYLLKRGYCCDSDCRHCPYKKTP